MASSPTPLLPAGLRFGVELELLVRPRSMSKMRLEDNESWDKRVRPTSRDAREQMENREVLRRLIAAQLSYYNIPTRALPDSDSVCGYEQWTVNDEETIYEEDGGDFWRVEVVSRILSSADNWQNEIDAVFQVLHDNWSLQLTDACGMHVHVSPGNAAYTMPQLQGLAKSLCLFEKPMKKLFPSNRIIDNRYIESNLDGPYANPELKRVFRHVRTESWNPVFSHLESADDTDSFVQAVSNTTKWVAWNFTCLNDLGTVESRRPPGVSSAAEATKWAGFTLAFVSAAITDTSYFNYYRSLCIHPSVEELYGFASNGLALINTGNNTPVDLEWMRAFA